MVFVPVVVGLAGLARSLAAIVPLMTEPRMAANWPMGTEQEAADSELADIPSEAGPLIVPLTLPYCDVVAPELTVVLTINHI